MLVEASPLTIPISTLLLTQCLPTSWDRLWKILVTFLIPFQSGNEFSPPDCQHGNDLMNVVTSSHCQIDYTPCHGNRIWTLNWSSFAKSGQFHIEVHSKMSPVPIQYYTNGYGWSCNGMRFRIRWKIDVLFNEANRILIFHRMRNLVPLHESIPLVICVVQHLEC